MFIAIANSIGARLQTYISQLIASLIQRHDSYENIGCTDATLAGLEEVSSNGDTLLRRASFVFTPTAYDADDLGVIVPDDGGADLTFSRGGGAVATRTNKDGLVETMGSNVPRINYSGKSKGCGALLLEPFSQNYITYSQDFSQWTATNVTVTDNFILSPTADKSVTAAKLDFDGTASANISLSTTASGTTTFSVYLRVPSGTQNVTIGVSPTQNSSVTVTDEWVRYDHTGIGSSGYISCDDDVDVYVWGAQLEQHSYPTSLINTNGSAVMRGNETSFKRNAEAYINSTEGVLYAETRAIAQTGTSRFISLDDETFLNYVRIGYLPTNNTIVVEVKVGNVQQYYRQFVTTQITNFKKIALRYKQNDFAFYVDGVQIHTFNSGNTFAADTLNDIEIESQGSSFFTGEVKCIAIFDEGLTNDDLEKLTS